MKKTLQAYALARLEKEPDHRAIAFLNSRCQATWYSSGEFLGRASTYAAFLAESGVGKGSVCVLVLSDADTSATAVLACVLIGAAPLLVAPSIQTAGAFSSLTQVVQGVVERTRPAAVVLDASLRATVGQFSSIVVADRPRVIADSELPEAAGDSSWRARAFVGEADLAGMQLTSGTTGFPKVCVWHQARVIAALEGMGEAMRLGEGDLCLNWTPLYHDMGLVNNFLLCLTTGVPLVMMRPQDFVKDPSLWLRGLAAMNATTTWSPNFGFALATQRCRDEDLRGVDLSRVRAFWNAAERIHFETITAFYERFRQHGVRRDALKTNFGCAENVGGATFSNVDGGFLFERVDQAALLQDGIARVVADDVPEASTSIVVGAGKPHSKLGVQILSDDGAPLPDGNVGEVALDSPSCLTSYFDDPEATARAFVGPLLRTGDLGYLRGGELFWVGRVQERINVRGVKLDPSDFESVLMKIEGLRPGCFAAFGCDDSAGGTQKVVVVAEVRNATHKTASELVSEIRNAVVLALGINIGEVVLVREGTLTKTSSGKRRHRFAKDLYHSGRLAPHLWVPGAEASQPVAR